MAGKSQAIERLQRARDAIPALKALRRGSPEFDKWRRNAQVAIADTFEASPSHVEDFTDISFTLGIWTSDTPDSAFQEAYVQGLERAESVLQSMVEEIEEYWEDESESLAGAEENSMRPPQPTSDVFVIHGRDNEAKETVARFLEKLGLRPIILHEQVNEGRTVIEKFERHAQVGFAIALLTPDDVGALASSPGDSKPRGTSERRHGTRLLHGCARSPACLCAGQRWGRTTLRYLRSRVRPS